MTNKNEDVIQLIKDKIQVFHDNKIIVHIKRKDSEWFNGLITEISADFIMLDERMDGLLPIFFIEIERIEKYETKGEASQKRGKNGTSII